MRFAYFEVAASGGMNICVTEVDSRPNCARCGVLLTSEQGAHRIKDDVLKFVCSGCLLSAENLPGVDERDPKAAILSRLATQFE